MKKLGLKKETLVDLTVEDLREVNAAGHGASHSCSPTYTCISCGECFNSFVCGIDLKSC